MQCPGDVVGGPHRQNGNRDGTARQQARGRGHGPVAAGHDDQFRALVDQLSDCRFAVEHPHQLVARGLDELANPGQRGTIAGVLVMEQ